MRHLGISESNISPHLVEKQLHLWQDHCRDTSAQSEKESGCRFITVATDEGSLGKDVAEELSRRLQWHVFDEEIIHYIAQNSHVSEKLVQELDQKAQSGMQDGVERFLNSIQAKTFGGDEYHEGLLTTLMCLAKHGSAIVVGRGGNFALSSETHGVRVLITASPEIRIQRLAERWKVSAEEARRRMQERDEEKRKFIRHYFWRDYGDVRFYDMVFNTDRATPERIAASIQAFLLRLS